nr:glycine dehydrogenase [Deltaproteobacteria bacterium]
TFNEFVVKFPSGFEKTHTQLREKKILAGFSLSSFYPELGDYYLLCVTETKTKEDMDILVREVQS